MATNKAFERGVELPFSMPTGVVSGQPVVIGNLAGVAQYTYAAIPSPPGQISIDFEGVYFLSVTAKSGLSPSVNSAVKPGDNIYADGGTTDTATNVTTGFTLDKASASTLFGSAMDAIPAGQTATIRVRLKVSPAN